MRALRPVLAAVVCATALTAVPAAGEPPVAVPGLTLAPLPVMNAVAVGDSVTATVRQTLAVSNKYFLNTWWQRHMSGLEPWASSGARVVAKGTLDSEQVRRFSSVALALATPLATRSYDPVVTSVRVDVARDRAVTLVEMLVRTHRANAGYAGWGGSWQSGLWASQAALAGWLCGPALSDADRLLLARMLQFEAASVASRPIHYLRDRNGRVLTPGDSGSEEAAWDAATLLTAVELLPANPDRARWAAKAYEAFVAAYSRPSDVRSSRVVNGLPLSRWLRGSNIEENGTVVNHGRVNPDYMVSMSLHGAVLPALTNQGVPAAVLHGNDVMHRALTSVPFTGPRYRAPGGTIYVPRSAAIYHPAGRDWGTQRQVVYGVCDLQVAALRLDRGARVPARTWASLHLGHVRRLQARFTNGQTYGHVSEDKYFAREEWTGALLAYAELFEWLTTTKRFRVDDRPASAKAPVRTP